MRDTLPRSDRDPDHDLIRPDAGGRRRPLVIGIGNRWRRDDGIGPRAVESLRHRLGGTVDLLALGGEATSLLEAWSGRDVVWVVDAVRRGRTPGTIHRLDGLAADPAGQGGPSTHGAGLADAIALGRALDRLPGRLVVMGIEPAEIDHGWRLSEPVAAAFGGLLLLLTREVERLVAERDGVATAAAEPYRSAHGERRRTTG